MYLSWELFYITKASFLNKILLTLVVYLTINFIIFLKNEIWFADLLVVKPVWSPLGHSDPHINVIFATFQGFGSPKHPGRQWGIGQDLWLRVGPLDGRRQGRLRDVDADQHPCQVAGSRMLEAQRLLYLLRCLEFRCRLVGNVFIRQEPIFGWMWKLFSGSCFVSFVN